MLKGFCLAVCMSGFFSLHAQNKLAIEGIIKSLEQNVVKGILEADTNLLKQVWAAEFMVNTPRNDIAKNREAVFENQKMGLINYSSFERVVEDILVQEDFVITMGYEMFVSRKDIPGAKAGQPVKRRFTNIWKMEKGTWQQIARHASIICS
ncbi:nuclear transport factor 2 family protein [Flavisolibacter sp. BT320]|nr:nuclear transport factor 2 family protein [Flavisolibacter longurius]